MSQPSPGSTLPSPHTPSGSPVELVVPGPVVGASVVVGDPVVELVIATVLVAGSVAFELPLPSSLQPVANNATPKVAPIPHPMRAIHA